MRRPGDVGHDQVGLWIKPGHASASIGIFHVALPVPDEAPDVELVVQDARPSSRMAVQRARSPGAPCGTRHTLGVQPLGDRLRRRAVGIFAEDPDDHRGLVGVDHPLPCHDTCLAQDTDDWIAEAETATRLPRLHAPAKTSSRFVRQVFQVERVHRAL
jgi:hypothetical protein